MSRRAELQENLARVEKRVDQACLAAGRQRSEITVITVTKTWPVEDIKLLAAIGITDIGESRDQEAFSKFQECRDLGLTWHFIGQIQTNKVKRIAEYADIVHALDRPKVVEALNSAAQAVGRHITGLVQVSLDLGDAEGRAGVKPDQALTLAEMIARCSNLHLGGVMGVAPLNGDARSAFDRLQQVSQTIRAQFSNATIVSAGMSDDLAEAVASGATHLRIGSAIMGSRSYVQ